jgi:hypothetical protein
MQVDHTLWQRWAGFLQRWRIDGLAAFLLEAGGPLVLLAAQALYFGQPFFRQTMPDRNIQALVDLLENEEEGQAFAAFLRERKSQ